ncbi:hypothetical protein LC653_31935 [Nostoc sp. CHAB 5784]|uniref:hypothetical protein n=1 Tax=Nostoc mirabile TaxID=2907820 RepID=UPI001E36E330|nr:hypothetical protein [Nostoc mirabile]MCC5668347.1 hypothetical protein [Nostoc mirabile CHAB5784]
MAISKEEIVLIVSKVLTVQLGIPQPLASGLTESIATYLFEKAIEPTVEAIRDSLSKIQNEQNSVNKEYLRNQGDVLTREELLEKANKDSAKEAGIQIAKSHVDLFMRIRAEFQVGSDEALLSTNINRVSSVPLEVRKQISELQTKFGKIINAIALHIEEKKYESFEQVISDRQSQEQIAVAQKVIMQQLVNADKTFHISCQSLKVAVDFFTALNEYILQEIENCSDTTEESRLILGNAVLVYELTDFVIKYLQAFKIEGIVGINSVKSEIDRKIQRIQTEIQELKNKANKSEIFPELKQNILSNISEREQAVVVMVNAWDEYLGEVKSISDESTGFIKQWIPNLELIRDDAKNQIAVLEVLTIVRVLKSNLMALKTAVTRLETMKLVSLSPDRVRRLLGL